MSRLAMAALLLILGVSVAAALPASGCRRQEDQTSIESDKGDGAASSRETMQVPQPGASQLPTSTSSVPVGAPAADPMMVLATQPAGVAASEYPNADGAVGEIAQRLRLSVEKSDNMAYPQIFRADADRLRTLQKVHAYIEASLALREEAIAAYGEAGWSSLNAKYGGMLQMPDFTHMEIRRSGDGSEFELVIPGTYGLPMIVTQEEGRWAVDANLVFGDSTQLVFINQSYTEATQLLQQATEAIKNRRPLAEVDQMLEAKLEKALQVYTPR